MKDFRTRKKQKPPFYHSWFFLLILVLVLGFSVRSAYASFTKKRKAHIEEQKYEKRFEQLEQTKKNLEDKIQHLKTDRGVEEELRKRFDVTKKGESIIKIIEPKNSDI